MDNTKISCDHDPFRMMIVLVLYKIKPCDSIAYQTLQDALLQLEEKETEIKVLLYDNSPVACAPGTLPDNVIYRAATENTGLAGAYNCGLEMASAQGYSWLLTLDQDTALPREFLARLREIALKCEADASIAAIVPQLLDEGRLLSPLVIRPWGPIILPAGYVGIHELQTNAYSSGSMFKVSALRQIGAFDRHFWLDHQDAWVYRQLYRHGKRVYVAGDIQVTHQLSLLHHKSGLTIDRYRNYLGAESAFCDQYDGKLRGLLLTLRLLGRIYRQRKRRDAVAIRNLTEEYLKKRLFKSRKRRIDDWINEMEHRIPISPRRNGEQQGLVESPSVSVCMAAYNGERYITAQLQSILVQLSGNDEVVVVDDGSTDGTRDRVRAFQDDRVRLIEHEHNQGMSHTFEDAIRAASNSIIFLSDQDDLWVPDKISTIRQAFIDNPHVTLIVTDSSLIHADGSLLLESYLGRYGPFRPGFWANLVRNRYGSHNLAFRASILSEILPLPHKHDVLHDHWIGLRHSLAYGDALYIDRPLTLSRRHETTWSAGRKRSSTLDKIRRRVHLLLALAEFSILKVFRSNGRETSSPESDSRNNTH